MKSFREYLTESSEKTYWFILNDDENSIKEATHLCKLYGYELKDLFRKHKGYLCLKKINNYAGFIDKHWCEIVEMMLKTKNLLKLAPEEIIDKKNKETLKHILNTKGNNLENYFKTLRPNVETKIHNTINYNIV